MKGLMSQYFKEKENYKKPTELIHQIQEVEQKEGLSPTQNGFQHQSISPSSTMSRVSRRSGDSATSEPRFDVNYGKFYNQSYLKLDTQVYKKGPPLASPAAAAGGAAGGSHFHRPENFSYSAVKRDYTKPKKGMLTALGDSTNVQQKKKPSRDPMAPMSKEEAIRMARYPDAHRPEHNKLSAIERPDWPGPPTAAAAYPELLREKPRRKSVEPQEDGVVVEEEVEEVEQPADPHVQKKIDELQKLQDSGVGKVILKEMEKRKTETVVMDPVSASRTPAANKEPPYKTRYETHTNASPSRFLDLRQRTQSMDDHLLDRKYRSQTLPVGNFPVPKPGYSLGPKSATLPASGDGAAYHFENESPVGNGERRISVDESELHDRSFHTSQSSFEEYDPETGLRRSRLRGSSVEGFNSSYLAFRRSAPNMFKMEEPPKIYSFEELKLSNPNRPPGVDVNTLERHLSINEFKALFNMTPTGFYRLPEWKQNDLKRRVELF